LLHNPLLDSSGETRFSRRHGGAILRGLPLIVHANIDSSLDVITDAEPV
jgi:hypothetical protein